MMTNNESANRRMGETAKGERGRLARCVTRLAGHLSVEAEKTAGPEIFSIIKRHRGAENAISADEIGKEIGLSERNIRKVIAKESHEWPEVVCARVGDPTGAGGYFIPETYEEIEAYWAYLSDLASKAEAKVQRFEQACAKAGFALKHRKAA